jgi:ParB family chromosome partitioning protein
MKSAEELRSRLGGNMRESMGAHRPDAASVRPIPPPTFQGDAKYRGASRTKDALVVDVDRISPDPNQPRKTFAADSIAELAASLKARGQLQPIRCRYVESSDRWIIVAGERRYRAALEAEIRTLMVIEAKGDLTAAEIMEDQITENLQREDLKPIEQARAYKALMDLTGCSYRELSERLSVSVGSISRSMALLTLPEDMQQQVEARIIPASSAAELAKIEDEAERREMVEKIVSGEMTRDEAIVAARESKARSTVERGRDKGRAGGSKAKPKPLPTERTLKTPGGLKVIVQGRKGVSTQAWAEALRSALEDVEARLAAETGSGDSEAA